MGDVQLQGLVGNADKIIRAQFFILDSGKGATIDKGTNIRRASLGQVQHRSMHHSRSRQAVLA